MVNSYYIDLTGIGLEQFQHTIETELLLPSQRVLLEDIKARMETLQTGQGSD